jgi:DeoR/GlpR family transcriptional regulator of sugar metabolism
MMAASAKCCLLVHHARFGRTALHRLADLAEFDHVITDCAPEPGLTQEMAQAGLPLTVAA